MSGKSEDMWAPFQVTMQLRPLSMAAFANELVI